MKVKRKGNVYPFLSSPPSSSSCKDPNSFLKLLPVAILTLALSLPNHDREVLAYLISRSLVSSTTTNLFSSPKSKCKTTTSNGKYASGKKIPLFECGCFDCYTNFWYRWDSSPNSDVIHQAIEAFEEHLLQNESPRKHSRGRKRGKEVILDNVESIISVDKPETEAEIAVGEDECKVVMVREDSENGKIKGNGNACEGEEMTRNLKIDAVTKQALGANHKGLARKVLPDVVGLLNSRLWSLWGPGI